MSKVKLFLQARLVHCMEENYRLIIVEQKGAINQIMKSICISLGKHNINVNAVLPGTVITNINKKQLSKNNALKKYFINRTPLKRLITPEEIAKVMLFLASDLSSGISGETILVDGGMAINFQ